MTRPAECRPIRGAGVRIGRHGWPLQRLTAHAAALSQAGNRRFIGAHGALDALVRRFGSAEHA